MILYGYGVIQFIINSLRSKKYKVVHFVILVHQVKVNFALLHLKYFLNFFFVNFSFIILVFFLHIYAR
jgi:hypothetical protein